MNLSTLNQLLANVERNSKKEKEPVKKKTGRPNLENEIMKIYKAKSRKKAKFMGRWECECGYCDWSIKFNNYDEGKKFVMQCPVCLSIKTKEIE